jgi:hypothetical protein
MLTIPYLCSFLLLSVWSCQANQYQQNQIAENSVFVHKWEYYVVNARLGFYRSIPDEATAKVLLRTLLNVATATVVDVRTETDASFLANSKMTAVPSLIHKDKSADEAVRVMVQKILTLSPSPFWKDSWKFAGRLNPALEVWNNRTVMISRPGLYDSNIKMYWLSSGSTGGDNSGGGSLAVDESATDLGVGYSLPFPMKVFPFNQMREDPRLLTLANGSLVIVYTSKVSLFEPPMQCFLTVNIDKDKAVFGDSIRLNSTGWIDSKGKSNVGQKNWIPLEYKHRLMFIQSINPMVIMQHDGAVDAEQMGGVSLLYQSNKTHHLPWRTEYGLPLRYLGPSFFLSTYCVSFFISQAVESHPVPSQCFRIARG